MNSLTRKLIAAFTLLEALLAAVVLAMAITAITMPFTASAQNQQEDARRTLAVGAAQELMEEILTRKFAEEDPGGQLGPESSAGEINRGSFKNIDDYNGYDEPAGQIIDMWGNRLSDPAAAQLSRHVDTTYVWAGQQEHVLPYNFIQIVVTVKYQNEVVVRLTRLVYAMQ